MFAKFFSCDFYMRSFKQFTKIVIKIRLTSNRMCHRYDEKFRSLSNFIDARNECRSKFHIDRFISRRFFASTFSILHRQFQQFFEHLHAQRIFCMYVFLFHAIERRVVISSVTLIYNVKFSVIHRFDLHLSFSVSIDTIRLIVSIQNFAMSTHAIDLACNFQISFVLLFAIFFDAMTFSFDFDENVFRDSTIHFFTFCKNVYLNTWKISKLHAKVRFFVYECKNFFDRIVRRIFLKIFNRTILLEEIACSYNDIDLSFVYENMNEIACNLKIEIIWNANVIYIKNWK